MSNPSGNPTAPSAPPAPSTYQSWEYSSYGQAPSPYGPPSSSQGQPPPSNGKPASTPYSQPPAAVPYVQPYYGQGQWPQNPSSYSSGPSPSFPPTGGYQGPYGYPPPYGGQPPQVPKAYFPPGTDPEIVRMFQMADIDGSGLIDDVELQRTLSGSQSFSLRTVRLMIHLYGPKGSKKIGPTEFVALWKALKDWKGIFTRFDRDQSGSIDGREMREALLSLGYSISPPILDCLLQKYDQTGQGRAMDYGGFIECGLIVKGLTDRFKEKDTGLKGSATLTYEAFMLMVLPFVTA